MLFALKHPTRLPIRVEPAVQDLDPLGRLENLDEHIPARCATFVLSNSTFPAVAALSIVGELCERKA